MRLLILIPILFLFSCTTINNYNYPNQSPRQFYMPPMHDEYPIDEEEPVMYLKKATAFRPSIGRVTIGD